MNEPSKEDLERLGAKPDKRPYGNPDPNCKKCGGTGFVKTPNRLRGGHVCPCTLEKR